MVINSQLLKWGVFVGVVFAVQIYTETHCSIKVRDPIVAACILVPLFALLSMLYWVIWRNIYSLVGSAWESGIYCALPISLAKIVGTYFGSRELPSKYQLIAIIINLFAVFVSLKE